MLAVSEIEVRHRKALALRDVSLEVEEGKVTAVLGPNGAGKSTLLRAISGMIKPTHGSILLNGERIDGLPPHVIARKGLTHCLERRRLFPEMKAVENLEVGAYARKSNQEVERDLQMVFDLFPVLKERRNQRAGTLSGGEQQMLAIGRALMARPRILLLDEPSLGLSPLVKRDIFGKISQIKGSTTILLVEQDIACALDVGDQFYSLQTGKIALEGNAATMREKVDLRRVYLGT